jgi:hypothetical protein
MAWKKKRLKADDSEGGEVLVDWLEYGTVSKAVQKLREALKEDGIHDASVDFAMMEAAMISVRCGKSLRTAPLLIYLLRARSAAGRLRWYFDSEMSAMLGIAIVRLLAAYFEDPAVSHQEAEEAEKLFLESIEGYPCASGLSQIVPGIRAVRTQRRLDGSVAIRTRTGLPKSEEVAESGMCRAAHRQWQVEYLLACGQEEAALGLADRGSRDSACGITCGLAPHGMYAWMLAPLIRRGRVEEAQELDARLGSLLSFSPRYLDSLGCRIEFAALQGRFDDAWTMVDVSWEMAVDPEVSAWQQLKFFQRVQNAFCLANEKLCGPRDGRADWLNKKKKEVGAKRVRLEDLFANRGFENGVGRAG